jgi:hypothetical protein
MFKILAERLPTSSISLTIRLSKNFEVAMRRSQQMAWIVCAALLILDVLGRQTSAREPYWPEDRPRAKAPIRSEKVLKVTDIDASAASRPPRDPEYVAASEDGDLSVAGRRLERGAIN